MAWPDAITDRSPVAFWRLGDSTGSTAADSSGNGHTGTASNVTFGQTGLGSDADTAALFTASSTSKIVVPHDSDFDFDHDDAFSVHIGLNHDLDSLSNGTYCLIGKDGGASTYRGWFILLKRLGAGVYELEGWRVSDHGSALYTKVTCDVTIKAGVNYSLIATFGKEGDADSIDFYLNGHKISHRDLVAQITDNQDTLGTNTTLTTADLTIGHRPGDIQLYQGLLDEIAIFDYELLGWEASQIAHDWLQKTFPYTPGDAPVPVIYDLDLGGDADDFVDLAMAIALHKVGAIDLIAVIVTHARDAAGPAARRILDYWGLDSVPVGQWKGADPGGNSQDEVDLIVSEFPDPTDEDTKAEMTDSTTLYTSALTAAGDGTVVIVTGGEVNSLDALIDAEPALFASKVKAVFLTIGELPDSITGISDATTSNVELEDICNSNGSVPLIFNTIGLGYQLTYAGRQLADLPHDSPSGVAWREYWRTRSGSDAGGLHTGRETWTTRALLIAAFGPMTRPDGGPMFYAVETDGDVTCATSPDGRTTFNPSTDSNHHYIGDYCRPDELETLIDHYLDGLRKLVTT